MTGDIIVVNKIPMSAHDVVEKYIQIFAGENDPLSCPNKQQLGICVYTYPYHMEDNIMMRPCEI